jgi:hypothetical protein
MTIEEIKTEMEDRLFPQILTVNNYTSIVKATLRELTRFTPISSFASFTTVSNVQDYKIFDTEDEVTLGVAAGATMINDLWWSPGGDWSSLNIYSPGWTMLAQMVIFTGSFFHQPSQMMLLRQKLDAWKTQFGSQGYEVIGVCGATDSILRLFPVPKSEALVVMELHKKVSLTDINDAISDVFFQWVEYYTADALANMYATTAGVDLLNFADSKDAMVYWQTKAQRYYNRAIAISAGISGQIIRS